LITLEGPGMIGVAGSSKDFWVLSQENVNVVFYSSLLRTFYLFGILSDADTSEELHKQSLWKFYKIK
jgi:hypothetical protein